MKLAVTLLATPFIAVALAKADCKRKICVVAETLVHRYGSCISLGNELVVYMNDMSNLTYLITPPSPGSRVKMCLQTTGSTVERAEIRRTKIANNDWNDAWGIKSLFIDGFQYNKKGRGGNTLWLNGEGTYGSNHCSMAETAHCDLVVSGPCLT